MLTPLRGKSVSHKGKSAHSLSRYGVTTCLIALISVGVEAAGLNSRTAIERAVLQIELGDYALARSYLERPLIDPQITVTERSRAYYLQGYSLELSRFELSAAQNYAKALAFNADNPATLAALGHLYARGLGVEQDFEQANDLLRRSAQLGHAPGMTRLGAMLLAGLHTSATPDEHLTEARQWLTSAAKVDDAEALLFLAQSYRVTHAVSPDPQQALRLYQQALVLNEPAAFNSIGHMYLGSELGPPDGAAAVDAFTKGAQASNGPSQVSLGYLYLVGNHVAVDHVKAQQLFEQAAEAGENRAHHYLGYLAETREPQTADAQRQAIDHYKQAATDDFPASLKRLGELAFMADQPAAGVGYLRSLIAATEPRPGGTASNRQETPYWQATHLLAWILATHTDAQIRNGESALKLAHASVAHNRTAASLDTLAAALAETRNYEAAINTQNDALSLLSVEAQRQDYRERLLAYQQQKPWRED